MTDQICIEVEIAEIGCAPAGEMWDGEDVHSLGEAEVAEMVDGDDDPFFVELIFMREGLGTGKPTPKNYTRQAVKDCVRLAPGLIGYLGHQDPKLRSREYRTPQMKVVAARFDEVVEGRKKVGIARAKAYVSRRSVDLRTHLREKMAGPVSIDGRAILERQGGEVNVTRMTKLRCIDLCNPNTEGIKGTGVQQIVTEIEDDEPEGGRTKMTERLSRAQLLEEHGAEIREMKREAVDEAIAPLSEEKASLEADLSEMKEQVKEREQKIERLEGEMKSKDEEIAEMKEQLASIMEKGQVAELKEYREELVSEMETTDKIRDKIRRRVDVRVIAGDDESLTKSREEIKRQVDEATQDVKDILEMAGGSFKDGESRPGGSKPTGCPPRKEKVGEKRGLAGAILTNGGRIYGGDGGE